MTPPPLVERQRPGLSETLTGPRDPERCQSCGTDVDVWRWLEADPWDRFDGSLVMLCDGCAGRLVKPHPRLYKQDEIYRPHPGAMRPLCTLCRHRDGLGCKHPDLKANGGPGLGIRFSQPMRAHFNYGGGRGEWKDLYGAPPSECAGREVLRVESA